MHCQGLLLLNQYQMHVHAAFAAGIEYADQHPAVGPLQKSNSLCPAILRVGARSLTSINVCNAWVIGIAMAKDDAHICRDVKPSNILLTKDGRAKVSDMGLSRADFFSSSTAFAGTFKYAAPEVLLGRPSNDKVHSRSRLYN